MKKNRLYFGILISVLVGIVAWASLSMLNVGKNTESYIVSVIVDDSNDERWTALRQGLEQAAGDYNIDLNYVSAGQLQGNKEELELIRREIENGADGIIVQLVSSEETDGIADISAAAAVMLLETDVVPEEVYAFAGPDNTAMGKSVAEAVRAHTDGALAGKRIGILAGNQRQLSMQQRLAGLLEVLGREQAKVVWCTESREYESPETLARLYAEQPVDIMIALSNTETELMVDCIQTESGQAADCSLFGVGNSEKSVYYLDKGLITALVVPNEFNMGYQSMEAVAKQLTYHLSKASDSQVDYLVVDRDNLYDEDNQKVLFPIVQ